jgi:hypothetical protein
MKYVSLDIETSSLEPAFEHILGLSMVLEDSDHPEVPVEELPHMTVLIRQPVIRGQAYALAMNAWILDFISGRRKPCPYPIILPSELRAMIIGFLYQNLPQCFKPGLNLPSGVVLAGKNVAGFDYQFLPPDIKSFFAHRVLDPGSVFVDWTKDKPLSLDEILQSQGFSKTVSHDMLDDARDVIRTLRRSYPTKE